MVEGVDDGSISVVLLVIAILVVISWGLEVTIDVVGNGVVLEKSLTVGELKEDTFVGETLDGECPERKKLPYKSKVFSDDSVILH